MMPRMSSAPDDESGPPPSERDHGLCGLGLVMQLGGDLGLALHGAVALQLVLVMIAAGGGPAPLLILLVWAVIGTVRYAVYRSAGSTLLFGGRSTPLYGFLVYGAFSLAQMALELQLIQRGAVSPPLRALMILDDLTWPGVLLLVGWAWQKRGQLRSAPRVTEGYGLEALPVLMVAIGAVTTLLGVGALIALERELRQDTGAILLVLVPIGVLTLRAAAHLVYGVRAAFADDPMTIEARIRAWRTPALLGAWLAVPAVTIALWGEMGRGDDDVPIVLRLFALVLAGAALYALLAWPRSLLRFLDERHAGAFAEGRGLLTVASADRGLAALGWLHVALAVMNLLAGGQALVARDHAGADLPEQLALLRGLGLATPEHAWVPLALAGLELWAGVEMIAVSARARAAGVLYALGTLGLTVWAAWPMLRVVLDGVDPGVAAGGLLVSNAVAVGLPLATILLTVRSRAPGTSA
jgi:hypothetical protein